MDYRQVAEVAVVWHTQPKPQKIKRQKGAFSYESIELADLLFLFVFNDNFILYGARRAINQSRQVQKLIRV